MQHLPHPSHEGGSGVKGGGREDEHSGRPVVGGPLVQHGAAHERTGEQLHHEGQVGALVRAVEGPDGARKSHGRVGGEAALRVVGHAPWDGPPSRSGLLDPIPCDGTGGHVEYQRILTVARRNPERDRVGPEHGLERAVRRHELWRLRHHDANVAFARNTIRVEAQRAGGAREVAQTDHRHAGARSLVHCHIHGPLQRNHAQVLTTAQQRSRVALLLHIDAARHSGAGQAFANQLDQALVVAALLRVQQHLQCGSRLILGIAVVLECIKYESFQLLSRN
mmetsp:Transcript_15021/g.47906  ORF Transcript_15021/g.47906 Transcript_15021/m.47906 type:complete len:279 (+) Transcript_15021:226-1062(+)